jgi:hypothetical protein
LTNYFFTIANTVQLNSRHLHLFLVCLQKVLTKLVCLRAKRYTCCACERQSRHIRPAQEIVLCTKEFPRVEQELLPEMRGRSNLHLLSVGWEEDRVQELARQV